MKKKTVYMCKNGHLHYGGTCPQECKHCGAREFGLITAENMEEDNGLPEEPGNDYNQE